MKFVVSSSALLSHLQTVTRAVNPKSTMPILECCLFQLQEGTLTITASDLETTLQTSMEVSSMDKDIAVALKASMLIDILKKLSEQPVHFSIDEASLLVEITFQSGKYSIPGISALDFPELPRMDEDVTRLTLPAQTVVDGINGSIFATADDELRPVMNGIFVDIFPDEVRFVASDAHKLVRYSKRDVSTDTTASFILPKKPANLLKAALQKETGDIELTFNAKNAIFKTATYLMVCRMIEGRFPPYDSVIPKNNTNKVNINRMEFLHAVDRVSLFSPAGTGLLQVNLQEDKMELVALDPEYSHSGYETLACSYSGPAMEIGFKAQYLNEVLTNLPSPEICLALSDPSRAALLMPVYEGEEKNSDGVDILSLLMPMMVR